MRGEGGSGSLEPLLGLDARVSRRRAHVFVPAAVYARDRLPPASSSSSSSLSIPYLYRPAGPAAYPVHLFIARTAASGLALNPSLPAVSCLWDANIDIEGAHPRPALPETGGWQERLPIPKHGTSSVFLSESWFGSSRTSARRRMAMAVLYVLTWQVSWGNRADVRRPSKLRIRFRFSSP